MRTTSFLRTISKTTALVLAAASIVPTRAGGPPRHFQAAWRGFDTGWYPDTLAPNAVSTADLDGDGDLDAVVGRWYWWSPGVSVLRNLGDGSFGPPEPYSFGQGNTVGEVVLIDFDADGDTDILASVPDMNGFGTRVAVLRNSGDGTFAAPGYFSTGNGPVGLAVTDFNRDGWPDAATADYGYIGQGNTVSILLHNGRGGAAAGFLSPRSFAAGASPFWLVAADLNGDGAPDLAVGRGRYPSSALEVLFNDGQGAFGARVSYSLGSNSSPVIGAADLDRDGDVDLFASRYQGDYATVLVYRNDGNGGFARVDSYSLERYSPLVSEFAFGDLNGDGDLDIVTANPDARTGESYHVLLSNGQGGYLPADRYPWSQDTRALAVADVDGDGRPDVLGAAKSSSALTVHLNTGGGRFYRPPQWEIEGLTAAMDAADIDRDGDLDVVSIARGVRILRNRGDGTFSVDSSYRPVMDPGDVKLRDMNGDGWPDLLISSDPQAFPYDFAVALNRGDGTFGTGVRWRVDACAAGHVEAVDVDGDGDLDVALTEEGGGPGCRPRIYLAINDGAANFPRLLQIPTLVIPQFIGVADLNHDGLDDLITTQSGYGLGVLLSNGDTTFREILISSMPIYNFTLADLDGDGILDAITVSPESSFGTDRVAVAPGHGDGSFGSPTLYTGSSVLETMRVGSELDTADADGDGDLDVFVTNYASNDIGLFLNRGGGVLDPQVRYGPGITPIATVVAEFNGDARPDIASVVSLPPAFRSALVLLAGQALERKPGDLDGDSDVDQADLAILLADWGCTGGNCPGDVDGDGDTDQADLAVLLAHFGT